MQRRKRQQHEEEADEVMYPNPNSNDPYATESWQQGEQILAGEVRFFHSFWYQDNHREKRTSSVYLTSDIIVDILSRLPAKSLLRLRCVCRDWQSLTYDPHFLKAQNKRALDRPIRLICPYIYLNSLYSYDFEKENLYEVHTSWFDLNRFHNNLSNSVHGLTCSYTMGKKSCYLLNPATRESVKLPTSQTGVFYNGFGLGYDECTENYKLVRIYSLDTVSCICHVLTLGTQEWRYVGEAPFNNAVQSFNCPVFLNGSLHWLETGVQTVTSIITFDVRDENFGHASFPPIKFDNYGTWLLKWRDHLCVACHSTDHLEIWMLKDNMWIKDCCCNVMENLMDVFPLTDERILLKHTKSSFKYGMHTHKDVMYTYDVGKKIFQKVKYNGHEPYTKSLTRRRIGYVHPYTESLISPREVLNMKCLMS